MSALTAFTVCFVALLLTVVAVAWIQRGSK